MRSPFKVRTAGHLDQQVVIGSSPDVLWLANIADAPILLGVSAANLLRVVGRSIVRDQEVEIAIALREDRVDGGRKIVAAVVDWYSDRNLFHAGGSATSTRETRLFIIIEKKRKENMLLRRILCYRRAEADSIHG